MSKNKQPITKQINVNSGEVSRVFRDGKEVTPTLEPTGKPAGKKEGGK